MFFLRMQGACPTLHPVVGSLPTTAHVKRANSIPLPLVRQSRKPRAIPVHSIHVWSTPFASPKKNAPTILIAPPTPRGRTQTRHKLTPAGDANPTLTVTCGRHRIPASRSNAGKRAAAARIHARQSPTARPISHLATNRLPRTQERAISPTLLRGALPKTQSHFSTPEFLTFGQV